MNESQKTELVKPSLISRVKQHPYTLPIIIAIIIFSIGASFIILRILDKRVYTDKSSIVAPVTTLTPTTSGLLEEVDVHEGDTVGPSTVVARVGNELVKTKTGGIILSINNNIGSLVNPGEAVATMINPDDLRVVAQVDEDKGLSKIHVGQPVTFTVDAFGSKKYYGVVDEVSPSSRNQDVVFSISDQRATQSFNVKIRFNTTEYPELKNGMSAKVSIYIK